MKRISDYFRSDKDLHSSQKKTKIENTDTGKHHDSMIFIIIKIKK